MFIIREVLVEDKKLPTVLRLLAGQVVSMSTPQPVTVNGSSEAVSSSMDVLKHMPKAFQFKDLADAMEQHGFSRKSAGNVITRGKEDKILKSLGNGRWSKI